MDFNVLNRVRSWSFNREQEQINKDFEENGLSDELLERQVDLNIRRNKYDIKDKNCVNDEGWSQ